MGALTPSFLFDLESNMRKIVEDEYSRLAAKENLWWSKVAKVRPSSSKREIVTWLLSTAQIEGQGKGGNMSFEDMVALYTEFTSEDSGNGLKIRRQQFEDLDGNGVDLATQWARDTASQMSYWPQKQVAKAIKAGETAKGYDGKNFFASDHPLNPKDASSDVYSNLFTSVGINGNVDTALANLQTIFAKIASIKMPNGEDPRFLKPAGILCGPKLYPRAVQLTSAKFIAQVAGSGAGSGDVEALIASMGFGMPISVPELVDFESDTTFFVIAEQAASSQLGALTYVEREPYKITYYTGQGGGTGADAVLDRAQELEWHNHGRNVVGYGHPFLLFKCKA